MTCFLYTYKIFFMVAWYNRPYQNQISANLSNGKIETQNINYFVKTSMSSLKSHLNIFIHNRKSILHDYEILCMSFIRNWLKSYFMKISN